MKRTAVTLSLLLAGVAGAADYATATKHDELLTPSREALRPKVQWAPSGNFSALHGRAVFEEESGEAARPYAGEGRKVAAGSRIFLSRDTEAGDLTDAPSLHRYAYAHGNPLRYLDVDGRRAGDTPQENIERVKREILDNAQRAKNQQRGEEFVVREGLSEQQLDEQWRLATEEKSSLPVLPTSSERSMAEFRESGKRWVNRGIFVATLGVGGLGTKVATGLAKKFGLSLGTEAALDIALNTIEGYVVGAGTEAVSQSIDIGVESRSAYDLGKVREAGVEGAKNAFAGSLVRRLLKAMFPSSGIQANKAAGDDVRDAIARREGLSGQPARTEVSMSTVGGERRLDVLVEPPVTPDRLSIESKVGRTDLRDRERQELARDWWLLRQGQVDRVRWEFSPSDVTGEVGPSDALRKKIEKLGFDIQINPEIPR